MNSIFVITTDFNGFTQTRRCLKALRASEYNKFRTIVVDHGTTSETELKLEAEFPEVIRIKGSSQLWWAGATNMGINRAIDEGADAVCLINSDCLVDPETIGHLVRGVECFPYSIIASTQYDLASRRIIAIAPRSRLAWGLLTLSGPKEFTAEMLLEEFISVELIGGGRGVLIPVAVLSQIGMLNEKLLPHYYADHDFYFRAKQHGVGMLVATAAAVYVDRTTTSTASDLGALSLREFFGTFSERRSHRNYHDVSALLRLHYPIPALYKMGLAMYFSRYIVSYFARRTLHLAAMWFK